MTASFRSTATPPQPRQIKATDRWLVDPTTGAPIGIENPNAGGQDGQFYPVPLTAAQIASPTAEMLADVLVTYCLNVAPYSRYMSNGSELVGLDSGAGVDANPIGIFGNLKKVISGIPALTLNANAQVIIYDSFTVENAGGVTIEGEMRVRNWPD